jgi:DNA processing protein
MLPHGGRMDTRTPSTTHLTDAQRIDWLRLIRSDNVGPRGIMAQTPLA